ncbi:hypothetical protein BHE74_00040835 [Ensete ventricosum]|nr:hypothetical protein BHE74_00040835 [Ensete ventricosum]
MARMGEEDASIPPRAAHMGLRKSGVVSSHAIALKHYPNVSNSLSLIIAVLNKLRRKDSYGFFSCAPPMQGPGKRSSLLVISPFFLRVPLSPPRVPRSPPMTMSCPLDIAVSNDVGAEGLLTVFFCCAAPPQKNTGSGFRKEELSIGLLPSGLAGPAEPANDHGLSLDIAVLNELRRKDAYRFCCCGQQVQGSGKRSSLLVPRT